MSPTKGATSAILDDIFKKIAALKAQNFKPTKLIVKMQNDLTVFFLGVIFNCKSCLQSWKEYLQGLLQIYP